MSSHTRVRFASYPKTEPPPSFTADLVSVFGRHGAEISTERLEKGLTSDAVLAKLAPDLQLLGFTVETSKAAADRVERPVFFGENGVADLRYQIDGFHQGWRCGLEIEAGRAFMGNAVYRDLIQASLMVDLDYLCLAVPLVYRFTSSGKKSTSRDYDHTRAVADAIYGHSRIKLPFRLLVVGY